MNVSRTAHKNTLTEMDNFYSWCHCHWHFCWNGLAGSFQSALCRNAFFFSPSHSNLSKSISFFFALPFSSPNWAWHSTWVWKQPKQPHILTNRDPNPQNCVIIVSRITIHKHLPSLSRETSLTNPTEHFTVLEPPNPPTNVFEQHKAY